MAHAEKSNPDRPHVPLTLRLKAWWNGCDVVVHEPPAAPGAIDTPVRPAIGYHDPQRPWETPRVTLAQMLWGEGFSHPGGAEQALRLVESVGLDPAMTVVDLSGGLGGGPRTLAEQYGVWVTALEQDAEFAAAGMQLSILAGVAKKAEIGAFVPAELALRAGSIDCIVCRELIHTVADKPRLLHVIAEALKPRGQFLVTDYVLADASQADSPSIGDWLATETAPATPWTLDDLTRAVADEKLEVRVTEDITDPFRRLAIGAWAELIGKTAGASLSPELKQCLVSELERWTRRIAAFDAGALRVMRLSALKNDSTGYSAKMLPDW